MFKEIWQRIKASRQNTHTQHDTQHDTLQHSVGKGYVPCTGPRGYFDFTIAPFKNSSAADQQKAVGFLSWRWSAAQTRRSSVGPDRVALFYPFSPPRPCQFPSPVAPVRIRLSIQCQKYNHEMTTLGPRSFRGGMSFFLLAQGFLGVKHFWKMPPKRTLWSDPFRRYW